MKILFVLFGYLKWHYTKAIKSLVDVWKNFLVFLIHFFSLRLMISNLFDHWKRMSDPYPKRFSFQAYLFAFIVNAITRLVGIIMRLLLLLVGSLVCLSFIVILPFVLIIWLVLPLIILVLLVSGIYLIIT